MEAVLDRCFGDLASLVVLSIQLQHEDTQQHDPDSHPDPLLDVRGECKVLGLTSAGAGSK